MEGDPTRGLADMAALVEEPRPTLTSLMVHSGDQPGDTVADVEVTLSWGKDWSSGNYSGPLTEHGLIHAAAAATLDALHGLLPPTVRFELRWVGLVTAEDPGSHEIINVLVSLDAGRGEEIYIGATLTRNDPRVAAVRATLDGINRRLMLLLTE
jgi:hypothetical protein